MPPPVMMKSTLTLLTRIGFWAKSENSTKVPAAMCVLLAAFTLVGSLLNLLMSDWSEQKGIDLVANVKDVLSHTSCIRFLLYFLKKRKSLERIITNLSDFRTFGKPPNFEKRNAELDRNALVFDVALYSVTITIFVWPLIYYKEWLVSPLWFPFDFSVTPFKQLVCFWQCYSYLLLYGTCSAVCMFMMETMEHLIIRIQHLKTVFVEITEETDVRVRQELLVKWVQYHLYIYQIGDQINDAYHDFLSARALVSGAIMACNINIVVNNVLTIGALFLFGGWLATLTILCIAGQHLIDESLSLAAAVYDTQWYQLEIEFQKDVFLILLRTQRPLVIRAGPFSFLSHLLYSNVLQSAYSYLNLLEVA